MAALYFISINMFEARDPGAAWHVGSLRAIFCIDVSYIDSLGFEWLPKVTSH